MHRQLKSRVECPDCDRVSITFDQYMFLSVPLPTTQKYEVEFTCIGAEVAKSVVYGIKVMYFFSFCVVFHFALFFFVGFSINEKLFSFCCVVSLKFFVDTQVW